jgi:CheY-like chemotaxis protein
MSGNDQGNAAEYGTHREQRRLGSDVARGPAMQDAFLSGALSRHFSPIDAPRVLNRAERESMLRETSWLALPCINNTTFACGDLDPAALLAARTYTVFRREDRRGCPPYLLWELAHDLRCGTVDSRSINRDVELRIRSLASAPAFSEQPAPVIVESAPGTAYLILDGNKRLTALALTDTLDRRKALRVWMGHSALPWGSLLSCYEMQPCAEETAAVVLVDDHDTALDGLTELLRGCRFPVVSFRTFEHARTFALNNAVRALVADVRLGDHNGLHLIQVARATHPDARLIAFSGHDDVVLKRDAEALGALYLSKPLDAARLLAALES